MNPIEYDKVTIFPDPSRDVQVVEWAKKKFFQVRIANGKVHIKINGLKVFKTMEIDGIEIMTRRICKNCLLKYGEKIDAIKRFLGQGYCCPLCRGKSL